MSGSVCNALKYNNNIKNYKICVYINMQKHIWILSAKSKRLMRWGSACRGRRKGVQIDSAGRRRMLQKQVRCASGENQGGGLDRIRSSLTQKVDKHQVVQFISVLKNCLHFSTCAYYPCAGAMLIFFVSFQF